MADIQTTRRPELGVIGIAGRDAGAFLQAQTTADLARLASGDTAIAAWLSPKGRIRGLFRVIANDDGYLLVTARDNGDWLAGELTKFVLRSDVTITARPGLTVASLTGDIDDWLTAHGLESHPGRALRDGDLIWCRSLPDRVDLIGEAGAVSERFGEHTGETTAGPADPARLAAIAAGLPVVPAALRERYTPHMLNLDRLGAVSFSKGCYPGQEIVARTENLGQAKRRIRRFAVAGGECPQADAAVVAAGGEPVGEVNRAAATASGFELLAVVTVDCDGSGLRLADGRGIDELPLPFATRAT